MIKNVIFDIGDVLIDFRWREHMVDMGFSEECIATLARTMIHDPLWDELDMGIRSHDDIVADMKAAAPMYANEIDRYFAQPMGLIRVRPRSAGWLRELRERGLGIYLLSNYPRRMFEQHSEVFDFLPFVDGMVVSSHVNLMKPDPAIYHALLDKYGLRAGECVFVDDRPVNTEAAARLGMSTVTYVSAGQAESELLRIIG